MCSDPITQDGNTFACRRCDECISTRRNGWVARAMAEKAVHRHAIAVTLTYDDTSQENRDGAAMFNYGHVNAWLKRLRSAIKHKIRTTPGRRGLPGVRFLIAGEQGSRFGRCHYHAILFSDLDLRSVGSFSVRGHSVTDHASLMSVGKHVRRLHWSLWPHGMVTLQEPDQAGMSYVLKYCLKDQFTEEKSRGTMREARSENFATGLFRMSKVPPMGAPWLDAKLQRLDAAGAVLPHLNLKIPDVRGFWYPQGMLRERLLVGLRAINDRALERTGRDAPQWSALLASLVDNDKDLEVLLDAQTSDEGSDDETGLERELARKGAERSREWRIAATVRTCGRKYPCQRCLRSLDQAALERLGLEEAHRGILDGQAYADFREVGQGGGWVSDPSRNPIATRINALCLLSETERAREAFPASAPRLGAGCSRDL